MELVEFLDARLTEDEVATLALPSGRRPIAAGKRAILDNCEPDERTLRLMASIYKNHGDYRQEWKP